MKVTCMLCIEALETYLLISLRLQPHSPVEVCYTLLIYHFQYNVLMLFTLSYWYPALLTTLVPKG